MRHRCTTFFRSALCVFAMGAIMTAANAADFPKPAALPAVADLPDPLTMFDGTKVTTKEQWLAKRKPELKELFQHYMYGYLADAPKITATVISTNNKFLGGKAVMKQIAIDLGPKVELLLVVPINRKIQTDRDAPLQVSRPVPVIVGLNFNGNHTVHPDPSIVLPKGWMRNGKGVENNRATDAGRGSDAGRWELENTIDQGFAVATIYYGDILPDKNDLNDGALPFFRKSGGKGSGGHGPTDMHAIAAWGWGLHRAVDYLVTDKDIDAKRIVAFGHSRNGKAALVAGAFDERIAITIPHQAGCGGSAPSRTTNPKAETVKRINTSFPHWFNANFKQFNDAVEKLPFDQHCLVAICAPRPVLFTNGEKDQWANPGGQLNMLIAAGPVYELLGVKGIDAKVEAKHNELIGDKLGYFVDPGEHTVTKEHWNVFIRFANKHFEK